MLKYSKKPARRLSRCLLLWVNGLFPFLWPIRHLLKSGNWFKGPLLYFRDYIVYSRRARDSQFPLSFINSNPHLFDRFESAGSKPRHYFLMDLWAARRVRESGVAEHYDIGSRMDGFIAHCAVFCKVNVLDVRKLPDLDENIKFIPGDASALNGIRSGQIPSLSSLHVFEHLGLGRYGDPLGPDQLRRAVNEAVRVLAPGGNFYFAVPVGIQRLEFNAHRVFAVPTVIKMFENLELKEFSCITDEDDLILNADINGFDFAEYSCGLFHFHKPLENKS